MSSDRSVRLLVVHETQNAAEELANLLRNSGMATQMTFIASANEFEQKLVQSQWDLIVIREGIEVVPTLNALGITKRYASNSPVLVLVDTLDDDLASDWFDAGASDICIEDHESLLLNRMRNLIQAYHFQLDASALNQQLEESEQRCQSMLQSSKDAIAYVHGGMHIFANQSYIELFECEDEDEVFCTPIMDFIDSSIHSQLKESLKNKFSSEELVTTAITAKEERLAVTLDFAPATYEGESCTQVIVRLKQDDVVENTVLEARLKELSQIDSVTGLLNFQAFTEQLEQQMTDDASAEFSLFYVLFSNALEIKQQVGFQQYPKVLRQLSESLSFILGDAVLCRASDESFVFYQSGVDEKTVCEKLVAHCREFMAEIEGKTLRFNATCGASRSHAGDEVSTVISEAQQATNDAVAAKQDFKIFDRSDIANIDSSDIGSLVAHALEHDSFKALYQPVISIRGDNEENYEIFVRLEGSDGAMIPAAEFIFAAEKAGLSSKIDRWVIKQVFAELASHNKSSGIHLFIHVSPVTIRDSEFLPWLHAQMKEFGVKGDSFSFQLSEDNAHEYLKATIAFSRGVAALKSSLLISGFSGSEKGMQLFEHLKIGYVKLNDDLVKKLEADDSFSEELAKMLEPLHKKGVSSIVPKIENAGMIAALWQIGVAYIQGYYVKEPSDTMDYDFQMDD